MVRTKRRAWSGQEDLDLLASVEGGLSLEQIATHLHRTVEECRTRLDEITKAASGVFPRETGAS
jgi:hypothetical protein